MKKSFVRVKPPPSTQWSILTEINRAGYQDEIFIQSPLSTCASESKSVCCQKRFICVSWCIFREAMRSSVLKASNGFMFHLGIGSLSHTGCELPEWAGWFCRDESYSMVLQVWGTSVNFSSSNEYFLFENFLQVFLTFSINCLLRAIFIHYNRLNHINRPST